MLRFRRLSIPFSSWFRRRVCLADRDVGRGGISEEVVGWLENLLNPVDDEVTIVRA